MTWAPVLVALCALSVAPAAEDGYDAAMKAARQAFAKGDAAAARRSAHEALSLAAEPEGGPRSAAAKAMLGEIASREKRYLTASWAFRDAAVLAGDDSRLRARYQARRRVAAVQGELKTLLHRLDELAKHDRLLAELRVRPAVGKERRVDARAKLLDASAAYRADKDPRRADDALAVRALVSVRSGEPEEGAAEAQALMAKPRPLRSARAAAYEALWRAHDAAGRLEDATRAVLALSAALSEPLPEERRRYTRMRGVAAVCARYEEQHGAGSCARLEREVTGRFTFDDFSRERARRELSDEDLSRAHRQFLPAIEDCVREGARKDRERFENSDIRISWSIQPKGSAADLEIEPKRYREDLGPCIETRLSWFRYPRYTSPERKLVTIPYHLD